MNPAVLRLLLAVCLGPGLPACYSSRTVAAGDGAPPEDGQVPARDSLRADGPRGDSRTRDLTAGPDLVNCTCKTGEVLLVGPCVATDRLSTCAPTCKVGDPAACATGHHCDQWAGTSFCGSAAALPSCVPGPAMGFPAETLRFHPTSGPAGTPVQITVEGGDFYIGALIWYVVFGGEKPVMVNQGKQCSFTVTFTPPKPGVYAVVVGYHEPQALAGFFVASGGVPPPAWVQPGYPCGPKDTCAQQAPHSCSCSAGRCRCVKAAP